MRQRPTARWPFWLLLAAWFCANRPQAATSAVLTWWGEARHSFQPQRLIGRGSGTPPAGEQMQKFFDC